MRPTLPSPGVISKLSIIVPVLNDDAALETNLAHLVTLPTDGFAVEVVVADGAQAASTYVLCQRFDAKYVGCERGRGKQMNAAAARASGDLLLFLHADCRLPTDGIVQLASLAGCSLWGSFRHRIDDPRWSLRIIEWAANVRAKWLALPYGDQAIFCRRTLFNELGGYREVPLLEDVLLARQLKTRSRPVQIGSVVLTDPRRWLSRGVLRTTWINWTIMWRFLCGDRDFDGLARRYRG